MSVIKNYIEQLQSILLDCEDFLYCDYITAIIDDLECIHMFGSETDIDSLLREAGNVIRKRGRINET